MRGTPLSGRPQQLWRRSPARSRADYEGFSGSLLRESRGASDSFAEEKGEIVLRSGLGCGKRDLFGVIAVSSQAVLWP